MKPDASLDDYLAKAIYDFALSKGIARALTAKAYHKQGRSISEMLDILRDCEKADDFKSYFCAIVKRNPSTKPALRIPEGCSWQDSRYWHMRDGSKVEKRISA